MTPAATLGLYAGGLVLVFAAAAGLGNAVGPVGTAGVDAPAHRSDTHSSDMNRTETQTTDTSSTDTSSTGTHSTGPAEH